tara:strand:- start:302 stop:439 length:138 start_codon:yes stop_codon:yes gene_type:complete
MPGGKKVGMKTKKDKDKTIAKYGGGGKIKKDKKMSYKKGGVIKKR